MVAIFRPWPCYKGAGCALFLHAESSYFQERIAKIQLFVGKMQAQFYTVFIMSVLFFDLGIIHHQLSINKVLCVRVLRHKFLKNTKKKSFFYSSNKNLSIFAVPK